MANIRVIGTALSFFALVLSLILNCNYIETGPRSIRGSIAKHRIKNTATAFLAASAERPGAQAVYLNILSSDIAVDDLYYCESNVDTCIGYMGLTYAATDNSDCDKLVSDPSSSEAGGLLCNAGVPALTLEICTDLPTSCS